MLSFLKDFSPKMYCTSTFKDCLLSRALKLFLQINKLLSILRTRGNPVNIHTLQIWKTLNVKPHFNYSTTQIQSDHFLHKPKNVNKGKNAKMYFKR